MALCKISTADYLGGVGKRASVTVFGKIQEGREHDSMFQPRLINISLMESRWRSTADQLIAEVLC